jgi:hypothetical protein
MEGRTNTSTNDLIEQLNRLMEKRVPCRLYADLDVGFEAIPAIEVIKWLKELGSVS